MKLGCNCMKVRKAVIPVGGLGTRFLPMTKTIPKEMLPIVNKPTIQLVLEEAIASGIEIIVVVTNRYKQAIENYFDCSPGLEKELRQKGKSYLLKELTSLTDSIDICIVRQKEPLGLGHAIMCTRFVIGNEPFAVLLADEIINSNPPALKQLIKVYEERKEPIIGVKKVPIEEIPQYGIVYPGKQYDTSLFQVDRLVEKPSYNKNSSRFAMIGRYVLTPNIFEILECTPVGKGKEIQLTDALQELIAFQRMTAIQIQGERYDVGKPLGYIQALIAFALKQKELQSDLKRYMFSLIEGESLDEIN